MCSACTASVAPARPWFLSHQPTAPANRCLRFLAGASPSLSKGWRLAMATSKLRPGPVRRKTCAIGSGVPRTGHLESGVVLTLENVRPCPEVAS